MAERLTVPRTGAYRKSVATPGIRRSNPSLAYERRALPLVGQGSYSSTVF
jgi:hypothetical protein